MGLILDFWPSSVVYEHDSGAVPAISVIMPLYNYAHLVTETLNSVRDQTFEAIELVVVEDRGKDDSLNVAQRWLKQNQDRFTRVALLQHETNGGLANARNSAVNAAKAPLYFPIDADNTIYPACLATLAKAMKSSEAGFAFSMLEVFEAEENIMGAQLWSAERLALGNDIDAMALVRRAAWEDVEGYSMMKITGWEDYDFWCKLHEKGYFGIQVPNVLGRYRMHFSSMLRTVTNKQKNIDDLRADMKKRHPWLKL